VVADTLDLGQWESLALACRGRVCGVLIAVRFVWVFAATYLTCWLFPAWGAQGAPRPPWQSTFVIAFTGIRGVVSLAAALSIPLMADGAPVSPIAVCCC